MIDEAGDLCNNDSIIIGVRWCDLKGVENKSITTSIKKNCTNSRKEMEKLSESVELKYIMAVMNSAYASKLLSLQRAGDYHIYPEHIRNIPIPNASLNQQRQIIAIADDIIKLKGNDDERAELLKGTLDEMISSLYNA